MASTTSHPSNSTHEELQSELANLKGDLRRVKDDLRSIAEAIVSQGRSSASAVKDRVQHRVQSGVESAQEFFEERPITSLLVVLGVGLIVGKLLRAK